MRGLRDRGALVTGGTSGIGLATARRLQQEGARVFVCGIDAGELESVMAELSVAGTVADVSREPDVARLVNEASAALERIDVLVSNAGIARKARFVDLDVDAWDRTLAVNLRGTFLVGQAVARTMLADGGGGAIVNMASTNALGGEEDFSDYNASKGGVLQLTRTMAIELGPKGIRVNCVCPGFIETPLNQHLATADEMADYERTKIPLGRRGDADEVAAAIAFLASDEASFVHGAALVIDGGQTAVM